MGENVMDNYVRKIYYFFFYESGEYDEQIAEEEIEYYENDLGSYFNFLCFDSYDSIVDML